MQCNYAGTTIAGSKRPYAPVAATFQNLISNAIKYRKKESTPEVIITCQQIKGSDAPAYLQAEDHKKNFYQITVADNGIGFEQAEAERIFQVFHRLHGNTEYMGTGVGLSTVRKVAENHGGYVWAQASPGKGATFYLLLPVEA